MARTAGFPLRPSVLEAPAPSEATFAERQAILKVLRHA